MWVKAEDSKLEDVIKQRDELERQNASLIKMAQSKDDYIQSQKEFIGHLEGLIKCFVLFANEISARLGSNLKLYKDRSEARTVELLYEKEDALCWMNSHGEAAVQSLMGSLLQAIATDGKLATMDSDAVYKLVADLGAVTATELIYLVTQLRANRTARRLGVIAQNTPTKKAELLSEAEIMLWRLSQWGLISTDEKIRGFMNEQHEQPAAELETTTTTKSGDGNEQH